MGNGFPTAIRQATAGTSYRPTLQSGSLPLSYPMNIGDMAGPSKSSVSKPAGQINAIPSHPPLGFLIDEECKAGLADPAVPGSLAGLPPGMVPGALQACTVGLICVVARVW